MNSSRTSENGGENVSRDSSNASDRIKALDKISASNIRNTQVITGVLDVVRELVENAVDAGATMVKVVLLKFGLEKIEVRDNGHGISAKDVQAVFQGSHTSKLADEKHLSRGNYLGFRGEALHAMCAVGNVSVTTKTNSEAVGRKYQLNCSGEIISQIKLSHASGTSISVEKLFQAIRVRRQRLENKTTAANELKEIECYLKGVAIVNPKCHLSIYHDSSLIWSKASVQTIQQALVAVLGHGIGKNLSKEGPIQVSTHGEDGRSEDAENVKTFIELFLPDKPVDMRTMSLTSNKLAMIFCNGKRVYIREYEKLIHRYITACVLKPQPADVRRFPVSVLCIHVPPKDVDFNCDIDKTKVHLVRKEEIREKIEEALMCFYKVDLKNSEEKSQAITSLTENRTEFEVTLDQNCDKRLPVTGVIPMESDICEIINKDTHAPPVPIEQTSNSNRVYEKSTKVNNTVSNFNLCLDSQLLMDDDNEDVIPVPVPRPAQQQVTNESEMASSPAVKHLDIISANNYQNWLEGRIVDNNGDVLQNVDVVTRAPSDSSKSNDYEAFRSALGIGTSNPRQCSTPRQRLPGVGVYSSTPPPPKKQKLGGENPHSFHSSATLTPTPSSDCLYKQMTLNSFQNWNVPVLSAPVPPSSTPIQINSTSVPVISAPAPFSSTPIPINATSVPGFYAQFPDFSTQISAISTPVPVVSSEAPVVQSSPVIPVPNCPLSLNQYNDEQGLVHGPELSNMHHTSSNPSLNSLSATAKSHQQPRNSEPVKPKRLGYNTWVPCAEYCDSLTRKSSRSQSQQPPRIIGKLLTPSTLQSLHIAKIDGRIGVLSSNNLMKQISEIEPSQSQDELFVENDAGDKDEEDVSALLSKYSILKITNRLKNPVPPVFHDLISAKKITEYVKESLTSASQREHQ